MKDIIVVIVIIMGAVAVALVGISGINKSEVVECNHWTSQAAEYSGFYLTHWQADQCKAHGIIINAPVK